uniref:Uncharacterized protein n=1 Tax=Eutreptiella gymnastica TaxID=73025 RepID=A0A7S4LJN1_9EUGL
MGLLPGGLEVVPSSSRTPRLQARCSCAVLHQPENYEQSPCRRTLSGRKASPTSGRFKSLQKCIGLCPPVPFVLVTTLSHLGPHKAASDIHGISTTWTAL